ncbi:hypothetical protein ACFL6S_11600 [Candidatus Poribacteria bacterium]
MDEKGRSEGQENISSRRRCNVNISTNVGPWLRLTASCHSSTNPKTIRKVDDLVRIYPVS